jgi:hypothetical protein
MVRLRVCENCHGQACQPETNFATSPKGPQPDFTGRLGRSIRYTLSIQIHTTGDTRLGAQFQISNFGSLMLSSSKSLLSVWGLTVEASIPMLHLAMSGTTLQKPRKPMLSYIAQTPNISQKTELFTNFDSQRLLRMLYHLYEVLAFGFCGSISSILFRTIHS